MRIFGLYITTAKRHQAEKDKDNTLIGKLMAEKAFLQKSTEKLLAIIKNPSRQSKRKTERLLKKNGVLTDESQSR